MSPAPTSTLFGVKPYQTDASSQGSIALYKDGSCTSILSDTATPIMVGECLNAPFPKIRAVSISSLPTCNNYGTPILLVSDQLDCKNSTSGPDAHSGVIGGCQTYSSGVDIRSMEFMCYGSGVTAVSATKTGKSKGSSETTTTTTVLLVDQATNGGSSSSGSSNRSRGCCCHIDCCCCCTVM